ncbi:hypothetical protein WCU81_01150 [Pectobacterium atrosepticum]|uniref:hypothetical protein n=1 Tax=Pectobacterium atrosepticum TaxID=29471 RepID=UPI00039EB4CB|nr:hypothetical protein [Pectobacterium atrosepticum]GKV84915.1 hypothetical protein PEC301296_12270 [Pectobacterium carotovorum subsp. carotovorum]AIA71614.1 hypothetical protein EV46_13685 [Pectobacterium atrosepticum]AIK13582.1 hypothetical protein GZ59_17620 [Pectobacterium atrosepticum]ATY90467.1 hypothetical protein CVS35_08960 [Pectobacterium atrosepticum]KFX16313.1 hypothetical protein JV34_05855 [Pectobacterium atrosepticum]
MENDVNLQHMYSLARQRVAPDVPVTVLCIGEQQTTVICGTALQPSATLQLTIGFDKTAATFFKHLPPTPDEMELAIMAVEDEVTRIRHDIPAGSALFSFDPTLMAIAQISGVEEEDAGWRLPQDDMERTFKRLERVMMGSPAAWEGIPLENAFSARLLILREFMHHHGFDSALILLLPVVTA